MISQILRLCRQRRLLIFLFQPYTAFVVRRRSPSIAILQHFEEASYHIGSCALSSHTCALYLLCAFFVYSFVVHRPYWYDSEGDYPYFRHFRSYIYIFRRTFSLVLVHLIWRITLYLWTVLFLFCSWVVA